MNMVPKCTSKTNFNDFYFKNTPLHEENHNSKAFFSRTFSKYEKMEFTIGQLFLEYNFLLKFSMNYKYQKGLEML